MGSSSASRTSFFRRWWVPWAVAAALILVTILVFTRVIPVPGGPGCTQDSDVSSREELLQKHRETIEQLRKDIEEVRCNECGAVPVEGESKSETDPEAGEEKEELSKPVRKPSSGLERYIHRVLYITSETAQNGHRRKRVEREICKLGLPETTHVSRLVVMDHNDGNSTGLCAHLAALCQASEHPGSNVLIVEDDFVFSKSAPEILETLKQVDTELNGRWDCVQFAPQPRRWYPLNHAKTVFRVLSGSGMGAYLVHRTYVANLMDMWMKSCQNHETSDHVSLQDPLHDIQEKDMWVSPWHTLGKKKSEGGNPVGQVLESSAPHRKRVAVCIVVHESETQRARVLVDELWRGLLKQHHIEFHIFTDRDFLNDMDLPVVHIHNNKLWNTKRHDLDRYRLILGIRPLLQERNIDVVLSFDPNCQILQRVGSDKLIPDKGLVLVEHVRSLVRSREKYYTPRLQGGALGDYMDMCQTIYDLIGHWKERNKTTKSSEQYLNSYVTTHPQVPRNVLDARYMVRKGCFFANTVDQSEECVAWRKLGRPFVVYGKEPLYRPPSPSSSPSPPPLSP